jgi:hypothetical protein
MVPTNDAPAPVKHDAPAGLFTFTHARATTPHASSATSSSDRRNRTGPPIRPNSRNPGRVTAFEPIEHCRRRRAEQLAELASGEETLAHAATQTGEASSLRRVEAAKVSAARHSYGVAGGVAVASDRPSAVSVVLPLLALVIGLAVATVWFVALPAFERSPAKRSCEVFVLKSGSTRCVPEPTLGSRAAPRGPKPSSRAKY